MSKSVLPPSNPGVLITGCSSGIGHAAALRLAQSGFTVFATVRRPADAERLRACQEPNLVPICPLDLTCREHITSALSAVQAELERRGLPGLYALVNNAGGGEVAPVELMNPDRFEGELCTRLVGPVALLQAVLPLLRRGQGRIVWIMTPALLPTPYVTSIHACDFAVNCLIRTLEIELQPWHIPTIQIRCGGIQTEKGLETTHEVETVLRHPRANLYREKLLRWGQEMATFGRKRTPVGQVVQVIERALRDRRPRQRYIVGHMAAAAALLEALPQPLADTILRLRF